MIDIRILVIDDEAEIFLFSDADKIRRQDAYKLIENESTSRTTYHVEGAYSLETYNELTDAGARKKFDVVLLDMDLSRMPGGEILFEQVIKKLANRFPVVVLSRKWDRIVSDLNFAFQEGTQIHGIVDITRFSNGGQLARNLANLLFEAVDRWQGDEDLPTLTPNEPIKIVHISDLQFGGQHTRPAKAQLRILPSEIEKAWRDYEHKHGNGESSAGKFNATFVVITGDIAEKGLPSEYLTAQEQLDKLIPELTDTSLPTRRLLLVPGNHDMSLGIANASRLMLKKRRIKKYLNKLLIWLDLDEKSRIEKLRQLEPILTWFNSLTPPFRLLSNKKWNKETLSEYSFSPFRQFAAKVTGQSAWYDSDHSSWVWSNYGYLGVLFFGINTSSEVGRDGLYRAELPQTDVLIDKLNSALSLIRLNIKKNNNPSETNEEENNDEKSDMPYIIGLMHHPIKSKMKGQKWVISNDECFETIRSSSSIHVPLVLCGHLHDASSSENIGTEEKPTHQIISSTATLSPDNRQRNAGRNVNLIVLEREKGKVVRTRWTSVPILDSGPVGEDSYTWELLGKSSQSDSCK